MRDYLRSGWLLVAMAIAGALAVISGCATPQPAKEARRGPVFYPQAPEPPRIQHLTTIASGRDIVPRTGFADFVLGEDTKTGKLKRPYGATLSQGKLYVADSRAPGIVIFDLNSRRVSTFEGRGVGLMKRPINVVVDSDGTRYVTDTGRNQVLVYDANGGYVAGFGAKGDFKPVGVAVRGDRLYVVDLDHNQIHVLDKRTGKLLFKFGTTGTAEEGALFQPTNIALGPSGDVYVVETGNFRVSHFDADGKFLGRFGEIGQSPGTFARPKGIAVDRAGRIYVGDSAFQNVQIFDGKGRVLLAFGGGEEGGQGLNLPAGITIDYDHVPLFRSYAAPGFEIEYLILVVSQFDPDQVDIFGFGRMQGVAYPADPPAGAPPRG